MAAGPPSKSFAWTKTSKPIDWEGQKKISLALQDGGSHGALTWGVIDYLLEDARLDIEAIGTSQNLREPAGPSKLS